jgi:hypothetical protein
LTPMRAKPKPPEPKPEPAEPPHRGGASFAP